MLVAMCWAIVRGGIFGSEIPNPASVFGVLGGVGGCPEDEDDEVGVTHPTEEDVVEVVDGGVPRRAAESIPGGNGDGPNEIEVGVVGSTEDGSCCSSSWCCCLEAVVLLFRPSFSVDEDERGHCQNAEVNDRVDRLTK